MTSTVSDGRATAKVVTPCSAYSISDGRGGSSTDRFRLQQRRSDSLLVPLFAFGEKGYQEKKQERSAEGETHGVMNDCVPQYQRDMKGREMTMHIHNWPTLIMLLIASMLQTACSSDTAPATSASPDLAPPEAHVRDVYIDWIRYDGNPLNDRLYANPDRFTADFIQRIDAMQNTPGGIGIDPLLCAQEVPIDFGTSLIRASDQTASVMVHMLWTSEPAALTTHSVQVELTANDGQWRIDNIICPAASYWWYTA